MHSCRLRNATSPGSDDGAQFVGLTLGFELGTRGAVAPPRRDASGTMPRAARTGGDQSVEDPSTEQVGSGAQHPSATLALPDEEQGGFDLLQERAQPGVAQRRAGHPKNQERARCPGRTNEILSACGCDPPDVA
jgi:hypothetical protein